MIVADDLRPSTFVDAVRFIGTHGNLVLNKFGDHLLLSGIALGAALVVAIPLGVWLGHLHRGSFVTINVSNVGRALPTLAVIAIGIPFLGLGLENSALALFVLAAPPILTNAYVGVDAVDEDVIEAARGMGLTPFQVLRQVEIPLALPLIFAGIRTSAVYVVSTATIAAVAGGGGLGDIIVNQASYRLKGVLAGAILVVLLAIAADLVFGMVQRAVTPRPLRGRLATGPTVGPGGWPEPTVAPIAVPEAEAEGNTMETPTTETQGGSAW
jgi:osmoprotectant transport system permease protein